MSGWKRIGVVLSVLWAIAVPLWLVADTNSRSNQQFESCLKFAISTSDNYADAIKRKQVYERLADDCQRTAEATSTALQDIFTKPDDQKALALFIGIPIAALWFFAHL
jgi:type II secretory pathway pseudopilin PulG